MILQFLQVLAVTMLVWSSGCASGTHSVLLERRFDQTGITMQHMQYFATAHLRAPDDRDAAIAEITAYLRSEPGSMQTNLPGPGMQLQPVLRSRDFWALVLAQLQGRELRIMAQDDASTRDSKIAALVAIANGQR